MEAMAHGMKGRWRIGERRTYEAMAEAVVDSYP